MTLAARCSAALQALEAKAFAGEPREAEQREFAEAFFELCRRRFPANDWWRQMARSGTPCWRGETLAGKTLLVVGSADVGDHTIHRFGALRSVDASRVIWHTPDARLKPLFERADARVVVLSGETPPQTGFDVYTCMGNLDATEQRGGPWFVAAPAAVATYRSRLADGPLVGLAWRSNADPYERRSIPAELFKALVGLPVTFVCLQYGDVDADLAAMRAMGLRIERPAGWDALRSLDDAASLTAACDLVAMIPHTGAHLAGALGVRGFLLDPFHSRPQWRCENGRPVRYPTLEQIRQPTPGDWRPVTAELRSRLEDELG